ncbi:hypothetical protein ACQP2P_34055 [Dactylosporangium sp. CA-139114]|uniref:hypothetical protein n=1 Tax=Dactylosporangium sp. CA-139114 TaxID=3239931 RepID=UPI003D99B44B
MTDLEQLIRRELADERHAPQGWTEPVRRIRRGIRRRRIRRYGTIAAAVTALAFAGTLLSPPEPAPAPGPGGIAWADTPATLPSLARTSPRPDASPCAGSGFTAPPWLDGTTTGADGTRTYTMLVPSRHSGRCTLSGTPPLIADGTAVPAGALVPRADGSRQPATVDPGEPVRVDIAVTPCPAGQPPPGRALAVTIGTARVAVPGIIEPGCGFAVSPWYYQAPLRNAPLTVTMTAPATVRRGTTLVYRVTISNAFPQAFGLDPCPVYRQSLGEARGTYRLNCTTKTIPRHSSQTYEMRLDVPASTPPGPARLSWMAATPDGTVAIADLATGGVTVQVQQ